MKQSSSLRLMLCQVMSYMDIPITVNIVACEVIFYNLYSSLQSVSFSKKYSRWMPHHNGYMFIVYILFFP